MQSARAAYGATAHPIRTPRGAEYAAFARATSRLTAASRPAAPFRDLAAALHENRRLWAALASDAAGEGNGLAPGLRARILYLAEFTRLHSGKVLRAEAHAQPLIDINSAVMRGLRDPAGAS